jgi:hypothetical protein
MTAPGGTAPGALFNDRDPNASTGYHQDSNGQWWLVKRSTSINVKLPGQPSMATSSTLYTMSLVSPTQLYGLSPGFQLMPAPNPRTAIDGVEDFATQWRVNQGKPGKGFPWWLWLLLAYAATRKGR